MKIRFEPLIDDDKLFRKDLLNGCVLDFMNDVFAKMKSYYWKCYNSSPVITLFIFLMGISLILTGIVVAIEPSSFKLMVNIGDFDPFTDHFNSVMYSIDHPYTIWHVIYPALITLFYCAIGIITEPFVNASGETLAYQMRGSFVPMLAFLIFMAASMILVAFAIGKIAHKSISKKQLFALIIISILSNPVIYAAERGNCLVACLGFCILFVLGHNSENKAIRLLSYVCLGVATGIKIFPAILAMIILRERNYRGFIECFIIVCVILFVPFIFTDGTFLMMVNTIVNYTSTPGLGFKINISQIVYAGLSFLPESVCSVIGISLCTLLLLLTLIVVFFDKSLKNWEMLFLISTNLIAGFSVPSSYVYIYMLIWIPYFLMEVTEVNMYHLGVIVVIVIGLSYAPLFFLCTLGLLAITIYILIRGIQRIWKGDIIPVKFQVHSKKEETNF